MADSATTGTITLSDDDKKAAVVLARALWIQEQKKAQGDKFKAGSEQIKTAWEEVRSEQATKMRSALKQLKRAGFKITS